MSADHAAPGVQRLLVINCGSSTLKWSVLDAASEVALAQDSCSFDTTHLPNLPEMLARAPTFDAVAHRFVHGGVLHTKTVGVDNALRAHLETLIPLAPLHLRGALGALDACRAWFPNIPHFAAFDTAFHRTLPEAQRQYALPGEWRRRWQLQRFGFHGLSVEYCSLRTAELLGRMPRRLIVCHLGSGCSITAVLDGRSLDTTMGFTPLEGPLMATRSGSIDPGLLIFLMRQGMSVDELEDTLLHRSGLLGLSEESSDLRTVIAAADSGSSKAGLAYDAFRISLTHALGSMLAVLGGVDALVLTGGIGENSPRLRADLLRSFEFAQVLLDEAANHSARGDARLSPTGSAVSVFALHTREDLTILRSVRATY